MLSPWCGGRSCENQANRLIEAMFAVLGFESALKKECYDGCKVGGSASCMIVVINQERDSLFHDG